MEARFGNPARATRDVDTIFRLGVDDDGLITALDQALADEYHAFTFEVEPVKQVGETVYRETRVRLSFNGRVWGSVKLEISPPEGSAQTADMAPALPLDFAGLQGPATLPCLPIPFQIAQKLHAVSERFPAPRQNDRQRDIIDLLLLRELVDDLAVVHAAAIEIFSGRGKHPWPPTLDPEPNWTVDYPADAQRFAFPIEDLDQAIPDLRAFIAEIDETQTNAADETANA
jgi:Nucleotidyl transferase AbiEii toxin, Type IV TA system